MMPAKKSLAARSANTSARVSWAWQFLSVSSSWGVSSSPSCEARAVHRHLFRQLHHRYLPSLHMPMIVVPMTTTATPRLNFAVQHWLVAKKAFIGCFVSMSFTGSVIEVVGNGVALALGNSGHRLALG